MIKTSTCACFNPRAQVSPPNPAPAMTTRGRANSVSGLLAVPPAAAMAAVGHLLEGGLAARGLQQRFGQLLLLLDHRFEEVAQLGDALKHLVGVEHQLRRVARLEALFDLVPRHWSGDGRPRTRTQRVDVDRRLVLVVLAPIDQYPTGAKLLQLLVDDEVRMLLLEQLRQA